MILPLSGGVQPGLHMAVRWLLSSVQALVCDWVLGWGVSGVGVNGAVDVGRMPPWVHTVPGLLLGSLD